MSQQFNEPTNYEILEAINKLSEHMDQQFKETNERVSVLEAEVSTVKTQVTSIESKMVTKEYLDEKLTEHSDEPIKFIHGTDDKVKLVSQKLTDKKIFTRADHQEIIMMKPFAGTI